MFDGLLAPSHLVILAVIALVLFGPKRLPEMGRSLGQGLRGFKESLDSNTGLAEFKDLKESIGGELRESVQGAADDAPRSPTPGP